MTLRQERRLPDTGPARTKVSCKDCVFFRWGEEGHQWRAECAHPHAQQGSTDWYGTRVAPDVRNAGQDCPDFRRETWVDNLGNLAALLGGMAAIVIVTLLLLYVLR